MHVLTIIAQILGYGWMAIAALLLLAILIDIAAERLRARRRRIDWKRWEAEIRHPAGRDFVSGEWK